MVLKSRGPTRGDLAALGGGGVGEVGGEGVTAVLQPQEGGADRSP